MTDTYVLETSIFIEAKDSTDASLKFNELRKKIDGVDISLIELDNVSKLEEVRC